MEFQVENYSTMIAMPVTQTLSVLNTNPEPLWYKSLDAMRLTQVVQNMSSVIVGQEYSLATPSK